MTDLAEDFRRTTAPYRRAVDEALDRYTSSFIRGNGGEVPERLRAAIRYSLLAPGKRLRPLLVLLATEACGGEWRRAMPAACAVEMIHAYSLIHDDLPAMDDDALRRGRPTCHIEFDEATAILAGDALIPLAFELLASELTPPEMAAACCLDLARAAGCRSLVGGQMDDLLAEGQARSLEDLEQIHRRKTGALLRVSLRLGGRVAGAGLDELAALDHYGTSLGLAFQITDDLLDCCGTRAELGKEPHKDAAHGKLTYPRLLGIEGSRRRAAALVEEACRVVEPLGDRAELLRRLARFVVQRNH